jgi:hypothetical protein
MTSFFDWVKNFQKIASISVAVILLAIGSSMIISPALKLYVFNFESSSYFNAQNNCNEEIKRPYQKISEQPKYSPKVLQEKMEKCIENKTKIEKKRYFRNKEESMIDGFVMVFIAFFLWIFSRYNNKK